MFKITNEQINNKKEKVDLFKSRKINIAVFTK